ncbi:hypothetical protein [Streptomyces sp. NPDC014734]|uniref:hypothetical protein n=1 Tax=Streptomyces sp. NPDC014734 TaxID=3364886 RepID=UPI0036F7A400
MSSFVMGTGAARGADNLASAVGAPAFRTGNADGTLPVGAVLSAGRGHTSSLWITAAPGHRARQPPVSGPGPLALATTALRRRTRRCAYRRPVRAAVRTDSARSRRSA